MKNMRVLVFGAHPDDETIGMGGTIYKHTQRGDEVRVVIMTSGDAGSMEVPSNELVELRKRETMAACKILGVSSVEFLGFKDEFLFLNEDTLTRVGRIIRTYKPHRVYTHHTDASLSEDNLDHINTFRIVSRAIFISKWPFFSELGKEAWEVREFYTYEVLSPIQEPNTFVDITDVMEIKLKAMAKYESQMKWGQWDEAVKSLNKFRAKVNLRGEYAEAFKVIKTAIL